MSLSNLHVFFYYLDLYSALNGDGRQRLVVLLYRVDGSHGVLVLRDAGHVGLLVPVVELCWDVKVPECLLAVPRTVSV